MKIPEFSIGEWLVCGACGFLCDAPFRAPGSAVDEPELVLGSTLPESAGAPNGEWQVDVAAACPSCGLEIRAKAIFHGRALRAFTASAA